MPLPMVHLLLAKNIENKLKRSNDKYFILGSIAPDSIHTRPGTNRRDKHKTHMFISGLGDEEAIRANTRNVKNVLEALEGADDDIRQFTYGYCIHTMLDILWINKIFNVLANTLRSGSINFNDIRTKYYQETDICDCVIYNGGKWVEEYRGVLSNINPVGFEDLLTKDEVGLWRDEVINKMDRYVNGEKYCPGFSHYITYDMVLRFTNEFADRVISNFDEWGYSL